MSFSAGFARGVASVEAIKRTQLERDRLTESTRRFDVQDKRAQAVHDEQMRSVEANKAANEYDAWSESVLADPQFQNEDGSLNEELLAKHPAVLARLTEFANGNPAAQEYLRSTTGDHSVNGVSRLIPAGGDQLGAMLQVQGADGQSYEAPMTANRSSDPNDPVQTFSIRELDRILSKKWSGYRPESQGLSAARDELGVLRGDAPEQAPSAQNQALSSGVAQPQVPADPAATPPPGPYKSPSSAVTQSQAPSSAVTTPEQRAATGSLAARQSAQDEASAPSGVIAKGKKAYQDWKDSGRAEWLGKALDTENTMLGADIRRQPERYSKDYARLRDRLAGEHTPEEMAQLDELFRPSLEADRQKVMDEMPKFKPGSIAAKRAQARFDNLSVLLDREAMQQPPVKAPRVADVSTPAKVAKTAENIPEPTNTQIVDSINKMSVPTKASVRSGKPSNAQLLAAMRLQKKNVLDGEQIAKYARTGKFNTDEFQFLTAGGSVWRANKTDGSLTTLVDGTSVTSAEDYMKYAEKGYEQINGMLKGEELSMSDFHRRVGEEIRALRERGIDASPAALYNNPAAQGILVEAYKEAKAADRESGWLTPEKEGMLRDALDTRYGSPQSPYEYLPGNRRINVSEFARQNNMSEEDARKAINDYKGRQDGPFNGSAGADSPVEAAKQALPPVEDLDFGTRLVRQIAEGEGTSESQAQKRGFNSGYDVPYGYGKYGKPDRPLTEMTVAEVRDFQRKQIAATRGKVPGTKQGTGAVGKYQVVFGTLKDMQKQLGFKDTDKFSVELQDRIGLALLNKRGYQDYKDGKITKQEFQKNLAREWASIADPDTGKSYYGQATGTSLEELEAAFN